MLLVGIIVTMGGFTTWKTWLPVLDVAVFKAKGLMSPDFAPGSSFAECSFCPTMVIIPAGSFTMGSPEGVGNDTARPQREVTIGSSFAVGKFEITFDQWDTCVTYGGCSERASDSDWGRGNRPVSSVNWNDAKEFVDWLSKLTGKPYRLLTEAEWEYAARAGSQAHWSIGDDASKLGEHAWFRFNSDFKTQPVGRRRSNAFGLHDMHGNASEWTEDCWNNSYKGAPVDGSAWTTGDCGRRVVRGGSWLSVPGGLRSADRGSDTPTSGGTATVSVSGGRLPLDPLNLYHWGPGRSPGRCESRLTHDIAFEIRAQGHGQDLRQLSA